MPGTGFSLSIASSLFLAASVFAAEPAATEATPKVLRAGIIGLDTSHVTAFTKTLNADEPKPEAVGVRVVAAWPGGSADIPSSINRVPGFTNDMKKLGVEIVDTIDELVEKVDVVMIESLDGRVHLEQLRPVFKAKKPVYIDKPLAANLPDVLRIYDEAKAAGVADLFRRRRYASGNRHYQRVVEHSARSSIAKPAVPPA